MGKPSAQVQTVGATLKGIFQPLRITLYLLFLEENSLVYLYEEFLVKPRAVNLFYIYRFSPIIDEFQLKIYTTAGLSPKFANIA